MLKTCSKCKKKKDTIEFDIDRSAKDGFYGCCKHCKKLFRKPYKPKIPQDELKKRKRDLELRRLYNITMNQYNIMLEQQENKCYICKKEFTNKICVDHNHSTNQVRKLLCNACNVILGLSSDSVDVLQTAIDYLKEHR